MGSQQVDGGRGGAAPGRDRGREHGMAATARQECAARLHDRVAALVDLVKLLPHQFGMHGTDDGAL